MSTHPIRREFRVSPAKLLHAALIAGLLALLGLWLLFLAETVPQSELIGLLNLLLAAAVLFFAMRKAREARPQMVIDGEGIHYRDWDFDGVPWRQVRDAYIGGSRLQPFLCIEIRDAETLLAGLTESQQRRLEANRLVRLPRLLVPNGALDAPLEEVLAALRAGLKQANNGET